MKITHSATLFQRGTTLLELLIGLAISAMIMTSLISMMATTSVAGVTYSNQVNLQDQAQFAIQRIALRIRNTPAKKLLAKANDASSGVWLSPATYDLRAGSVSGTLALTETIGAVVRILAEPVTEFSMTSQPVLTDLAIPSAQSLITVSLRLKNGDADAEATLSTRLGGGL